MSLASSTPINIAIFASGGGSNALKIIQHFADRTDVNVSLIVANKADAGVLKHATDNHIPALVLTKRLLNREELVAPIFDRFKIDFVALAGFLLLMPEYLVKKYERRMVNIHPALLPKYGGKGMYGMNVHRAVKEAGEEKSGMTIHYVDAKYDEGNIIFQDSVLLDPSDTPEDIARKVLSVEHASYAPTIDKILSEL